MELRKRYLKVGKKRKLFFLRWIIFSNYDRFLNWSIITHPPPSKNHSPLVEDRLFLWWNKRPYQVLKRKSRLIIIISKAGVKRATKKWNVFCNVAARRVEKRCCACFHPRIKPVKQVFRSCVNTDFWLYRIDLFTDTADILNKLI